MFLQSLADLTVTTHKLEKQQPDFKTTTHQGLQSVPYLSDAQQHKGHADVQDELPRFPHRGLRPFCRSFMAAPTLLSLYMCQLSEQSWRAEQKTKYTLVHFQIGP